MKAKSIIIAAFFALISGILFAGNEDLSAPVTLESTSMAAMNLAPGTPMEATFEEVAVMNDFSFLAPATPAEADFNDVAPVSTIDIMTLAPIAPAEADFNDSADVMIDVNALAPVTPATADFE